MVLEISTISSHRVGISLVTEYCLGTLLGEVHIQVALYLYGCLLDAI